MSHLRIVVSYTYFCCVFVLFCFRLVYLMLPVSLDCPILIAPSIFSNVYYLEFPKETKCIFVTFFNKLKNFQLYHIR